MKASKLTAKIYREHVEHFGEPDKSIRFGGETCIKGEEHIPSLIDIFIWLPDKDIDITTFATIGMSDKPMNGTEYRVELHFAIRKNLRENEISKISAFLANLAVYPFLRNTFFDWYHILSNPLEIPNFKTANTILFLPAFVENGWDTIQFDKQTIKILNAVPITNVEKEIVKNEGVDALYSYFETERIDIFTER